jgi:hypothetical protein
MLSKPKPKATSINPSTEDRSEATQTLPRPTHRNESPTGYSWRVAIQQSPFRFFIDDRAVCRRN